tara:strand:- start:287 stop:691 length:405 start_codon:yes stop_codon:yes gene_type:complete
MENLLFIALMVGSFVIRFFIKQAKEKKEKLQKSQSISGVSTSRKADVEKKDFDVALKKFSDNIARDLITNRFQTKNLKNKIKQDDTVVVKNSKNERFDRFKIKKKKEHSVIGNLKSPTRLKEMVVAAEVLKSKF